MKRRIWLAAWLLLLLSSVMLASVAGAPGGGDNDTDGYLLNGGFEGDYYAIDEELIAQGWQRVHLDGSPDWMSTKVFANGGWAERIGGENSHILSVDELGVGQPFKTVLYQQVNGLTPGRPYSFSGWTLKMWGGSANREPPTDPYSFRSRIGIDPAGGSDPTAERIVWSEDHWETRGGKDSKFVNQWVAAMAQSNTVTVFVEVWLKWHRPWTQAIVDGMELYDAPNAMLHTPSGLLNTPYLDWSGALPAGLDELGNYAMFYEVQQKQADGAWATLVTELRSDDVVLPLPEGETVEVRVLPYSYQPREEPPQHWPPSTHYGLSTTSAIVTLDTLAPIAWIDASSRWLEPIPFPLNWKGSDSGGGVTAYDVEYRRVGTQEWARWLSSASLTTASFGSEDEPESLGAGDEWEFRVRAHDAAGNVGEWSQPLKVGLVLHLLRGKVLAANGEVIPGAHIMVEPYDYSDLPPVGVLGDYLLPFASSGPYTLSFYDADGTRLLPDTEISVGTGTEWRDWYLPPTGNAVANGHFEEENGAWSGKWKQEAGGASGRYAAGLDAGATISQTVLAGAGNGLSLLWRPGDSGASIRIELGNEQWAVESDGSDGWQSWYQPVDGEHMQLLTLTATGGQVKVDDVALGEPQPPAQYVFLSAIAR